MRKIYEFISLAAVFTLGTYLGGCAQKKKDDFSSVMVPYLGAVPGDGLDLFSLPAVESPQLMAASNLFLHTDGNCNGVTSGAQQSACHTGKHFFLNAKTADQNLCIVGGLVGLGVLPTDNNYYYIANGNERILVKAQMIGNVMGNFTVKMCGGSTPPSLNYGYTHGTYSNGTMTVQFRRDAANYTGSGQNILAKISVTGQFGGGGWLNKSINIQYVSDHTASGGGFHYDMTHANGYLTSAFAVDPSSTGRMAFAVLGNNYSSFALGQGASGGGLTGTLTSPQGWNDALSSGSNSTYESMAGSISSTINTLNYPGNSARGTYGIASASQPEGWDCLQPTGVADISAQVQAVMPSIMNQCQ